MKTVPNDLSNFTHMFISSEIDHLIIQSKEILIVHFVTVDSNVSVIKSRCRTFGMHSGPSKMCLCVCSILCHLSSNHHIAFFHAKGTEGPGQKNMKFFLIYLAIHVQLCKEICIFQLDVIPFTSCMGQHWETLLPGAPLQQIWWRFTFKQQTFSFSLCVIQSSKYRWAESTWCLMSASSEGKQLNRLTSIFRLRELLNHQFKVTVLWEAIKVLGQDPLLTLNHDLFWRQQL